MSGSIDDMGRIFEGIQVKPVCQHRAIQLCKEQNVLACGTMYVCGKCSEKFMVNPIEKPTPEPKEPMFPKHSVPWGLRGRQA